MPIYFTSRQIVIPGDLLAENGYQAGLNTYKVENKIYAYTVGLIEIKGNRIDIIPIHGCYVPKVGDMVIGKIIDYGSNMWAVDINSPYLGVLTVSEALSKPINPFKDNILKYLNIGDFIKAKVVAFDKTRDAALTVKEQGLGKISKGFIITIEPTKIPRVIGRKGSMLTTLKNKLSGHIEVGKNGRIWIIPKRQEDSFIYVKILKKIEEEAHISGLTDRVAKYINETLKNIHA
jgi:exosome complex component RRP4